MRIAIIGGGIGGMTFGLSLLDAGIDDVDVYESTMAVELTPRLERSRQGQGAPAG
jgi:cation diffusion facilitator CzcD-associated flavoprotein CzcO